MEFTMLKKTLIVSSLTLSSAMANAADVANSNLQVSFESAHLQGAGNQITMLKVPVTNKETGVTQFFDMSAVFAADKNGGLVFKNISSVKSVAFGSANQLIAGHYLDTNMCSWFIEGPSVGSNGRLSWTIYKPGNNKGCESSNKRNGQILSGPLAGNEIAKGVRPYEAVLKKNESNLNYGLYRNDYLLSATQSGKSISFVSYYGSKGEVSANWTIMLAPNPGIKEE